MPAKDSVTVRMTAEDAGSFEMWRKAADGPTKMGDAIENASNQGQKASKELGKELDKMLGYWTSIGAAIELVKKAAEEYFKLLREHRDAEESATRTIDQSATRYAQVQKLTTQSQIKASADRVGGQATKAGVTSGQAYDAATMLGEFGFNDAEATGDSLGELLKFQQAAGVKGMDSKDFSRQILEVLKRSGGKHDAASIHKLGALVTSLTGKAAGFDSDMMGEYSAVADAAHTAGLSEEQGLALYAALREKEDKPKHAISQFKAWMAPGMQKGEAAARARAAQLMGSDNGESDYQSNFNLQSQTLGFREQAASTQKEFSDYQPGILSHQLAHDRLVNALRANNGGNARPIYEGISSLMLDFYEYQSGYNTERAVENMFTPDGLDLSRSANQRMITTRERILGNQPIPTILQPSAPSANLGSQISIRLKGQDGRDVPHSVDAVGIQSR